MILRITTQKRILLNLLTLIIFLNELSQDDLSFNYENLVSQDNFDYLNKLFIEIENTEKNNKEFGTKYKIEEYENVSELNIYDIKFNQAGFFAFLNSKYKEAKNKFNNLHKDYQNRKLSNQHMVNEIKKLKHTLMKRIESIKTQK